MEGHPAYSAGELPDWREAGAYDALSYADRRAFAWEWVRRTKAYQHAWQATVMSGKERSAKLEPAARFGLVAMVDPARPANVARPLWRAEYDRSVIVADVLDEEAPAAEGLDLLTVADLVTLEVDAHENQYLLLSDGAASIRVDVMSGTVLGGPALLDYRLWGAARLREPLLALRRLIALVGTGRLARSLFPPERKAERWILELRVADALAAGATHREIADLLFGELVPHGPWRGGDETARSRVQRLARAARRRSRDGAHLDFLRRCG